MITPRKMVFPNFHPGEEDKGAPIVYFYRYNEDKNKLLFDYHSINSAS